MRFTILGSRIYIFAAIAILSLNAHAKFDQGPPPHERPTPEKTEAVGAYAEVSAGGSADMEKLKIRIAELENALAAKPMKNSEEEKKLAEHNKDRALKKIRKMECPKPDSMFGDNEDEMPDMPGMGGGPDRGAGPGMNAQMLEEIEDAMEDKMAKCKKLAQRQQMQSGQAGLQNGMQPGMSMMGNSAMAGMNMQGMSGMNSARSMNQFPVQMMSGNSSAMNPWLTMMSAGNMYGTNSQYSHYLPSYLQMNMNRYGSLGSQ